MKQACDFWQNLHMLTYLWTTSRGILQYDVISYILKKIEKSNKKGKDAPVDTPLWRPVIDKLFLWTIRT